MFDHTDDDVDITIPVYQYILSRAEGHLDPVTLDQEQHELVNACCMAVAHILGSAKELLGFDPYVMSVVHEVAENLKPITEAFIAATNAGAITEGFEQLLAES